MSDKSGVIKGIVRGRTIELEREPGLPDGQVVSVLLRPGHPSGHELRRAFGAWGDDAGELTRILHQ